MTDTEIYGTDYDSKGLVSSTGDIGLVTELDNAKQAIRNRLLTRIGTYPTIDTEYGSEIHEILGEKHNDELVSQLSVYVNNCMLEEPRVYEVSDLDIEFIEHGNLKLKLQLQLVDGSDLGFEETIETLG